MAGLDISIPELKLGDGTSMPMLGYGTGTAWYKRENVDEIDRAVVEGVKTAIKVGYRHLDTAEIYNTEQEVGLAIKESKIERDKLFVTTKVYQSWTDVPKALDSSLKKLGLDYVDLYLVHAPFLFQSDEDVQKVWRGMEEVKASGKAKSIGVSNYLESQLKTILAVATVPPSINQIEYHPYLQHENLLPYMRSENIAVSAFGSLAAVTKAKPGPCDELLAFLAKKYYVSESEISLRWCLEQQIAVITTSGKEQRLSDYLRIAAFKMTPKEVEDLGKLGLEKHYRGFWPQRYDENDRS